MADNSYANYVTGFKSKKKKFTLLFNSYIITMKMKKKEELNVLYIEKKYIHMVMVYYILQLHNIRTNSQKFERIYNSCVLILITYYRYYCY